MTCAGAMGTYPRGWPASLRGIGAVAMALLLGGFTPATANAAGKLDLCGFHLVFQDRFRDFSIAPYHLGRERWIAHTPWNGDFGDAEFRDPGPVGPFWVADGKLNIIARRNAAGKWRSGLIAAGDASGHGSGVQYGYFEARMRLPPGPGTWPAFWLVSLKPVSDPAPKVEFDVIEYYGHNVSAYEVGSHVWFDSEPNRPSVSSGGSVAVPPNSLVERFHDYGVNVTPDQVTYYLDRVPVWQQPTPAELKTPLFPLVDLALGSGYSIKDTPNPSVLSVDYVRIYAPNPKGRAISARCVKAR